MFVTASLQCHWIGGQVTVTIAELPNLTIFNHIEPPIFVGLKTHVPLYEMRTVYIYIYKYCIYMYLYNYTLV